MRQWLVLLVLVVACRQEMYDRAPRRALGASPFFADRSASRPVVADTVARSEQTSRPHSGRERYAIYCAPCHGPRGDGDGIIVRHGFPRPPSFSSPEAMAMTPDDVAKIIAEGRGAMYSYGDRVPESDRRAIAAYIRTLQTERRP